MKLLPSITIFITSTKPSLNPSTQKLYLSDDSDRTNGPTITPNVPSHYEGGAHKKKMSNGLSKISGTKGIYVIPKSIASTRTHALDTSRQRLSLKFSKIRRFDSL